jgi:hypothetical protein
MSNLPPRPVAPVPNFDNIPAELKQCPQWVVWRYEINEKGDKWTKVPYKLQTKKASPTCSEDWISYEQAKAEYETRRQTFDGIGFVFSCDDPYIGGDRDDNLDLEGIPPTYTEVSPSGEGVKFIARATGTYGSNKAIGEIYSWGRFFTITGNVIPGREEITECQEAVEAFAASIGACQGHIYEAHDGRAGTGERAANAAAIPAEEWEEARQIRRGKEFNRLLARLRGAAISRKTRRDDTQLGYLLREDYRGFHEKWPKAQIVRNDGSLDASQIRACMASNIRSRGFTRTEYIALMSFFFGQECLMKWKYNKQAVREELATLWFLGRSPRADEYKEQPVIKAKRGPASDHQELLERAYQACLTFRAGAQAITTTKELAQAVGVARETMIGLLQELQEAGRISYRTMKNHRGIIIEFEGVIVAVIQNEGVIYSNNNNGATPHHNNSNGASHDNAITATQKETISAPGVIYSTDEEVEFTAAQTCETPVPSSSDNRDAPPSHIYSTDLITNCVDPRHDHTLPKPCKKPRLNEVIAGLLEEMPRDRLDQGGELKAWPVTLTRVREAVEAEYGDTWPYEAIKTSYEYVRKNEKRATFRDLEKMPAGDLNAAIRKKSSQLASLERKAAATEEPVIAAWYGKLASQTKNSLALLRWERDRRDAREDARPWHSETEQREFLALADEARDVHRLPRARAAPSTQPVSNPTSDLIQRLKDRNRS